MWLVPGLQVGQTNGVFCRIGVGFAVLGSQPPLMTYALIDNNLSFIFFLLQRLKTVFGTHTLLLPGHPPFFLVLVALTSLFLKFGNIMVLKNNRKCEIFCVYSGIGIR